MPVRTRQPHAHSYRLFRPFQFRCKMAPSLSPPLSPLPNQPCLKMPPNSRKHFSYAENACPLIFLDPYNAANEPISKCLLFPYFAGEKPLVCKYPGCGKVLPVLNLDLLRLPPRTSSQTCPTLLQLKNELTPSPVLPRAAICPFFKPPRSRKDPQ